jgi:misacylated tRNA(Ala) deacylase
MTDLVYLHDAYRQALRTRVREIREGRVGLQETIFYPGGGGQPPDQGWLRWSGADVAVVGHDRDGETVWHRVDGAPPEPDSEIEAVLDWAYRYAVMRHHSAVHVLSGVVHHLFHVPVTGGQIYHDRARMDFALEDLTRERVTSIEAEANKVIANSLPVRVRFMSRKEFEQFDLIRTARDLVPSHLETIRVVEIEGFDAQADGGTHIRNTGEIGTLRVVKTENKGKINRRLEIALHL